MNLIVPLLTIVPIPYIRIDDMTIQFKANISASAEQESTDTSSSSTNVGGSASVRFGIGPFFRGNANFNANYSSKKDSTATQNSKYSVEYTMDVYVHAVQDALPAGMSKVLNMLNENINTVPTKGEFKVIDAPKEAILKATATVDDKNASIYLQLVDGSNIPLKGVQIEGAFIAGSNESVSAKYIANSAPHDLAAKEAPLTGLTTDEDGNVKIDLILSVVDASKLKIKEPIKITISAKVGEKTVNVTVPINVSA
jgi:hypothetical protein